MAEFYNYYWYIWRKNLFNQLFRVFLGFGFLNLVDILYVFRFSHLVWTLNAVISNVKRMPECYGVDNFSTTSSKIGCTATRTNHNLPHLV